jgi:transcriptional regulator with XRE-family HTH domain
MTDQSSSTRNRDNVAQAFGDALKALRVNAGVSQEQMSRRSGMERTYISQLERGLRDPSLSYVLRVAEFFKVAPGTLVRDVARRLRKGVQS